MANSYPTMNTYRGPQFDPGAGLSGAHGSIEEANAELLRKLQLRGMYSHLDRDYRSKGAGFRPPNFARGTVRAVGLLSTSVVPALKYVNGALAIARTSPATDYSSGDPDFTFGSWDVARCLVDDPYNTAVIEGNLYCGPLTLENAGFVEPPGAATITGHGYIYVTGPGVFGWTWHAGIGLYDVRAADDVSHRKTFTLNESFHGDPATDTPPGGWPDEWYNPNGGSPSPYYGYFPPAEWFGVKIGAAADFSYLAADPAPQPPFHAWGRKDPWKIPQIGKGGPRPPYPTKPGPKVKEKKVKVAVPPGLLGTLIGWSTESLDVLLAFVNAMPAQYRSKPKWEKDEFGNYRWRAPTPYEDVMALYKFWPHATPEFFVQSFYNVLSNEIGDAALGKVGKLTAHANQLSGVAGGYQLGDALEGFGGLSIPR